MLGRKTAKKILILLGHPAPGSFNHAIADTAKTRAAANGHEVIFHDLYAEGFDPLLTGPEIPGPAPIPVEIESHCRELAEADGLIVVHPNWWGQPPAILKGWVDRVCRPNIAYRFLEGDGGEGVPEGLLKARAALVFNTANTPRRREITVFGDPLELLWKNCIFDLCGVKGFYRRMFEVVVASSEDQRRAWLDEVRMTVDRFFPPGRD